MEAYYQQQSVSSYFAGHYRQRGSRFGALAAGIGWKRQRKQPLLRSRSDFCSKVKNEY